MKEEGREDGREGVPSLWPLVADDQNRAWLHLTSHDGIKGWVLSIKHDRLGEGGDIGRN